jgi:hypothetical protein
MAIWVRRTHFPSVSDVSACACLIALAIGLCAVAGCSKPSSDNIQLWKTTQKGPDRIRDALADPSVAPRLRAEAAAALVDIGRADDADAIFTKISADDRSEILKTLIPLHEVAMKDPAPEKALAARDALFSLREYAGPEDQKRIDGALIPSIAGDLRSGHLRNGRHSIDKIIAAIGPDAANMLADVLGDPASAYPLAAELLGKVAGKAGETGGGEAARDRGASLLIARAQKEKAKEKEKTLPPAMWKAIGAVGGPAAIKFLEERALSPNKDEAVSAVRALNERRDPAVLPFALKVAGDAKADKLVRDEMFGVVETIGGLEARRGLVAIISSDREELVRYRAFEAVITSSKADGIVPALDAFPAGVAYKKVDVGDLLVKLIEKLGPSARPALVAALDSRAPLTRMTAVLALEQVGHAAEAPALAKLAGDTTTLKGFPPGETIGKEAARVADLIGKKA